MLLRISLFISILFLSLSVLAAEDEVPTEFDAVLIPQAESIESTQSEIKDSEFTMRLDPEQLATAPAIQTTYAELLKLSEEMKTDSYQQRLQTEVMIPMATASEHMELLTHLSPEDLNSFMTKKTHFLEKSAKFFRFIRLPFATVNKILITMNERFFLKAKVVANANATVTSLQFGIGAGVGLPDWVMTQLKKSPYFQHLPDTAGFYFLYTGGFSLVRMIENGKAHYYVEPVVEIRKSTKIFSPFGFAAIGFVGSQTWENRKVIEQSQNATFYKISMLSVIEGEQHFGFSGAAAAVFPPAGGAISGIEGTFKRIRLTPARFSQFIQRVNRVLQLKLNFGNFCARHFKKD